MKFFKRFGCYLFLSSFLAISISTSIKAQTTSGLSGISNSEFMANAVKVAANFYAPATGTTDVMNPNSFGPVGGSQLHKYDTLSDFEFLCCITGVVSTKIIVRKQGITIYTIF